MNDQASQATHNNSGSIEIPADLILGSDIPPAAPANVIKEELEDHDLIAILEGDDGEIMENKTETELRVGGVDQDKQELDSDKERVKEIAMRQMASLPQQPKGQRPKQPLDGSQIPEDKQPVAKSGTSKRRMSRPLVPVLPTVKEEPEPLAKPKLETENYPAGSTIGAPGEITDEGQALIIPPPRIPESSEKSKSPSPTKTVVVVPSKPAATSIPVPNALPQKASPAAKALPQKSVPVSKACPPKHKLNPPVPRPIPILPPRRKTGDLVSSLVSDWEDEPLVLKKEPVSPVPSPDPNQTSATFAPAPGFPMGPPPPQPPSAEEPQKRIIKKKIIWDPDNPETHVSFSSIVRANRIESRRKSEARTATPTATRPPGTKMRKRAESVAAQMIQDTPPQFVLPPPRKRARTPEPISKPTTPVTLKKKKKSEIDRLREDEGVIKMLRELEFEKNNTEKPSDCFNYDEEYEKGDAVFNQNSSPNKTASHVPRVRPKRHSGPIVYFPAPEATTSSSEPPRRKSTSGIPARNRKRPYSSALEDWSYVYNSPRTMIIHRRSNSSYTSSSSSRRISIDLPSATHAETPGPSSFEFVKPSDNLPPQQEDIKLDSTLVAPMKGHLSKVLASSKHEESPASTPSPSMFIIEQVEEEPIPPPEVKAVAPTTSATTSTLTTKTTVRDDEKKGTENNWESVHQRLCELKLQELTYKRIGNYVEIVLASQDSKQTHVFTVALLIELKSVLNILKNDSNTKAVLLRSSGKHFCRGIDLPYLIQSDARKRKAVAQEYSGQIRNFLQSLATFNKPLVAAVHGDLLGMGVTILPLFDVVIAQDTTTFHTPYAIFGYLPEAMQLFSSAKNLKAKAITDMLFLCEKVSASTALDYGIVSEVTSPEMLQERADIVTKKLATLSQQALKATKNNLRKELLERLADQLTFEQRKQAEQWISAECQEKFKLFVSRGWNC